MADDMPKVGDDLKNGWFVAGVTPERTVRSGGAGTETLVVHEAHIEAHNRVGDTLVPLSGSSMEQLQARIDEWQRHQPNPDPNTPDGNREMSEDERMESAKATMSQLVTEGARPSAVVNLTPVPDSGEEKTASISVPPVVEVEEPVTVEEPAEKAAAASRAKAADK